MRLRTINESIGQENPGYIDPKKMEDGTFEREMWMISAKNITVPEEKARLITYIEHDLFVINRVKAGKMKNGTAQVKRKIPRATEEYLRETLEKLKKYKPGKPVDEAKYNPIRKPEPGEPITYKIKGYHTTLADRWPSIKQKGLIPGAADPGGQDWKGDYAGIGVYFHQELPMHEIDASTDGEQLMTVTLEANFSVPPGYVVPDEEAGKPEDTPRVMEEKGPIAVAIRIPPNDIKTIHLKDDDVSKQWVKDNPKLVKDKEVVYHK